MRDESERDQYGRRLRYVEVEVDGDDVGAELVRAGLALARLYPPDMVQISVGRNWSDRDDLFEYVALGHGVPRSTDLPMSAFEPLAKLARRARAQPSMFPFFLDLFDHIGTLPADGGASTGSR